jgi:hypothetical protein
MKPLAAGWYALVVAIGAFGLPVLAAAPEPRPSPLAGVKALDKPVTLTETKIPLGELVQKLAAETGALLVATRDVADEPVSVVVKDLPARELLEQLADLLEYTWSKRGKAGEERYEIWQDLAAKNREAALRDARMLQAEQRLREEVRRYVEIARLPEGQFRAMQDEEKAMQRQFEGMTPAQQLAFLFSGEGTTLFQKAQRLQTSRRLASPIARTLARLLGGLSPAHWAELRAGRELDFSTSPDESQARLPEDAVRSFRSSPLTVPEYVPPEISPDELAQIRQQNEEQRDRWKNAAGYRVSIRQGRDALNTEGSLSLHVQVRPTRTTDAAQFDHFGVGDTGLHFSSSDGSEAIEPMIAEFSPERRAEKESDPLLREKKSLPAPPARQAEPRDFEATRRRQVREFLLALTRAYEVQIIGDSYGSSMPLSSMNPELYQAGPLALWQYLDMACGPTHRWDHQGRVIRVRSRKWFMDRFKEIPERLLRRWKDQLTRQGAFTRDTWAEIASLRDAQLRDLPTQLYSAGLPHELHQAYSQRHMLRLAVTLTAAQQQALRQGQRLPLAAMTPRQREFFMAALREQHSASLAALDPEELAAAGLTLRQRPVVRVREQHGGSVHFREESPPPPDTAPEPPPAAAGSPAPRATRHEVITLQFFAHYGPVGSAADFTVATP